MHRIIWRLGIRLIIVVCFVVWLLHPIEKHEEKGRPGGHLEAEANTQHNAGIDDEGESRHRRNKVHESCALWRVYAPHEPECPLRIAKGSHVSAG